MGAAFDHQEGKEEVKEDAGIPASGQATGKGGVGNDLLGWLFPPTSSGCLVLRLDGLSSKAAGKHHSLHLQHSHIEQQLNGTQAICAVAVPRRWPGSQEPVLWVHCGRQQGSNSCGGQVSPGSLELECSISHTTCDRLQLPLMLAAEVERRSCSRAGYEG